MAPKKTLVLGAGGQLGQALVAALPGSEGVTRATLDVTDADAVAAWPWHEYAVVLNAAAYTAVDAAETAEGRRVAWAANATAPATLARLAREHGYTLVHYSSEYVFDGTAEEHVEDEPLSPLGVYAQTKAAGDIAVGQAPRHYVLRTSWVIGEGHNFVRTMESLAAKGVSPSVVADQVGRLTFTDELVRATRHLLGTGAPHGTYHVSNGGPAMSWAEVARAVFAASGRSADDVTHISTDDYAAGVLDKGGPFAPRPLQSAMSLDKIRATGFEPEDALVALERYLASDRP
jgi:dTDP-4-dehydrorhamnose 3,5-epimerase